MLSLVDGVPAVVLERDPVARGPMSVAAARPAAHYHIEISGRPCYAMDICLAAATGDHNHAGSVATAIRIVNVPASGRRTGIGQPSTYP